MEKRGISGKVNDKPFLLMCFFQSQTLQLGHFLIYPKFLCDIRIGKLQKQVCSTVIAHYEHLQDTKNFHSLQRKKYYLGFAVEGFIFGRMTNRI